MDRASRLPDTYTLQVKNGSLSASVSFEEHRIYGSKERVEGQTALVEPISHELEDFRAVYWVHDTPSVLISHGHRSELRQYLDEEECGWWRFRSYIPASRGNEFGQSQSIEKIGVREYGI